METKEEFEVDHLTIPTGTSFSQLLLADDDVDNVNENALVDSFSVDQTYNNNNLNHSTTLFSFHNDTPKMLCFENYQNELMLSQTPPYKSVITSTDCTHSSSVSSCNKTNTAFNSLTKSNILQKKRNGSGQEPGTMEGVVGRKQQQRAPKKTKADNPTSTGGHAKKKEKLGERIAALQQLVSPFGKTDTASVLHEATGYIRFLHDQVQVLCSPYLQSPHLQFQPHTVTGGGDENYSNNGEEIMKDLRSRGLCLIPVGCTLHVASSNGADFWSPANAMSIGNNNVSPSAKQ